MDLQAHQDSQPSVVVVNLEHQASQGRGDRKEKRAVREFLCQVPLDVLDPQVPRVHKAHPDLQVFPPDRIVLLESLDVLAYRERGDTQERRARKV